MTNSSTPRPMGLLRGLASMKLASMLLLIIQLALACATVYEAQHGSPRALAEFYTSWWFEGLLGLFGFNVLFSIVVRWPLAPRQAGFAITHLSLLLVLAGAWVTQEFGIQGQLGLQEGQTAEEFRIDEPELTIEVDQQEAALRLPQWIDGTAEPVVFAAERRPEVSAGGLKARVLGYLPDARERVEVLNDNPQTQPAIEVSMPGAGTAGAIWIFADEMPEQGSLPILFSVVSDAAELERRLNPPPPDLSDQGTLVLKLGEKRIQVPVAQATSQPASMPESGYSARVLRYLPHAMVQGTGVANASERPVNPAVEVEISGPSGTRKTWAFACFPELGSMHGRKDQEGEQLEVTLERKPEEPGFPIEIFAGPDGRLQVRFSPQNGEPSVHELSVGQGLESPWDGIRLTVLRRFDRARRQTIVEPVSPPGENPSPTLEVEVSGAGQPAKVWVRKHMPVTQTLDDRQFLLVFTDATVPLGFALKLDEFTAGRYPGSHVPRSFESQVTIIDREAGREQPRVISMNNPTKYGGYTLFQSSFTEGERGGADTSVLSVSRNPGKWIVFTGYFGLIVGLIWVVVLRMIERRPQPAMVALNAGRKGGGR